MATTEQKGKRTITRQFHLFDAQGKVLGRLATEVAGVLSGKVKVDYEPNFDKGDYVVLINSDGIQATGRKADQKMYHHYSGYPGGMTSRTLKEAMKRDSRKVVHQAIYNMLPKNLLRDRMLKRLFIFENADHTHKIDITH